MDKITLDSIAIEVTQRCNMACSHCLKGDARDVDISLSDIDALLDQVELIGILHITGGEPTLNLKAIDYIADGLCRRGIPLLSFNIITNGLIFSEQLIEIMKRYKQIVDISCANCLQDYDPSIPVTKAKRVNLQISQDKYHEEKSATIPNMFEYCNALKDIADVGAKCTGNAPISSGRAKHLKGCYVTPYSKHLPYHAKKRLEIMSKDFKPACIYKDSFNMFYPDQKIVCCDIAMDAYGYLRTITSISYDDSENFPTICHVSEPIWKSIIKYNRDRIPCPNWQLGIPKPNKFETILGLMDMLRTAEDAQDYSLSKSMFGES